MTVSFDFGGDASRLILEMRKIQNELRSEQNARRTAAQQSRQIALSEQARLRDQIREGRNAKRVVEDLGRSAAAAMVKAKNPSDEYTRALFAQEQALKAGAISLSQFTRRKFELLRVLREAKREQSGENQQLIEAARLVNAASANTQKYNSQITALGVALRRGKIDQQQYANGVKQAKQELDRASVATDSFGKKVFMTAGAITGFTGGLATAMQAIAALRAEYDRLIERQKLARDAQITLAEAQEQASFNLGDDPTLNITQLFDRVRAESRNLGINEKDLTKAVSDALSARGNESAAVAVDSVVAAAKLRRFAPEELPQLSGAALDISKVTGKSLEESLGFLMEIGTLSRVTNLKQLAENIAPGVIGGTQFGVTPEFAGAASAALSQGIVDPTGRTTRTTITKLLDQLREFRPDQDVRTTFDQVSSQPALKEEFFRSPAEGGFGASFESKALTSVEGLLTQGTKVQAQFLAAVKTLETSDNQARFDQTVANVDTLPAVQIARISQSLTNLGDQVTLADQDDAISGAVREGLKSVRENLGQGPNSVALQQVVEDVVSGGTRTLPELISKLETLQTTILNPKRVIPGVGPGAPATLAPRILTDLDRQQGDAIGKTLSILEKILADRDAGAVAKKAARDAPPEQPPPVAVDVAVNAPEAVNIPVNPPAAVEVPVTPPEPVQLPAPVVPETPALESPEAVDVPDSPNLATSRRLLDQELVELPAEAETNEETPRRRFSSRSEGAAAGALFSETVKSREAIEKLSVSVAALQTSVDVGNNQRLGIWAILETWDHAKSAGGGTEGNREAAVARFKNRAGD